MKNRELRAKKMRQLEAELNKIKFNNVKIGSVMALYWGQIFGNSLDMRILRHISFLFYYHFIAFKPKPKFKDFNKTLLYFKTGNHKHLQFLEDAVVSDDYLRSHTLVVGQGGASVLEKKDVMDIFNLKDLIKIWSFFSHRGLDIWNILKGYQISKFDRVMLFLLLFCQLTKVQSLVRFLTTQKSTLLVGGDYDRGADTAVWFAVANALKLKSFTFQHGVINPPYGYNPLIADEIWVWGEMAKQQLISLGVCAIQIEIVGTPIIEKIEISDKIRKSVLEKLNLKKGINVILALSTPNLVYDKKLVGFLKEIQILYGKPEDNFLVKLHPARKTENFKWVTDEFGIKLLPNPMAQSEFMNIADIVLAHSSGLATEALLNGIKVGILDMLPISSGNGLEIHKYCGVPLLKKVSDFEKLIMENSLAINDQIVFAIDKNAKKNINKRIYEKIHS
jgi:hypothetical protein